MLNSVFESDLPRDRSSIAAVECFFAVFLSDQNWTKSFHSVTNGLRKLGLRLREVLAAYLCLRTMGDPNDIEHMTSYS